MTRPAGACPNCGAPIEFRWSSAVQSVCPHCRSVVVRRDVDLEAMGTVADLPPHSSPIQIGTTGRIGDQAFTVVGRIVYAFEEGGWNEWHFVSADGSSGWLSDAMAQYAVSWPQKVSIELPGKRQVRVGETFTSDGTVLHVTTVTQARYVGVEGELPFESWNKDEAVFADLRSTGRRFMTIDYSEDPPLLFAGSLVDYDELHLQNVRVLEAPQVRDVAGFNCANCGAPVPLRALQHTRTAVCPSCAAIIDPNHPEAKVLQKAALRERIQPKIPLGTRGRFGGHDFDVIGFQRRAISVDGTTYEWDEYLLFDLYRGFRYLSDYQGHWNDITVMRGLPEMGRPLGALDDQSPRYDGATFRHFQSATARTVFVLGEFPWRVEVGEAVRVHDFVAPPLMLSCEGRGLDVTWSLGTYTPPKVIWEAFGLPGAPADPVGVFANQPAPQAARARASYRVFALLAAMLVALALGRLVTASNQHVLVHDAVYSPQLPGEKAYVTDVFTLPRPGTLRVDISTNLLNAWLYLDVAVVNADRGEALNLGREVGYYTGTDSDGAWTEGSQAGSLRIPRVDAGRYYLRVEPEGEGLFRQPARYRLDVRYDVPRLLPYGLALGILAVPPVILFFLCRSFEHRRWMESDHAPEEEEEED